MQQLALVDLRNGTPALTPVFGQAMEEAASVCLHHQGHLTGVEMTVEITMDRSTTHVFHVRWGNVTAQMLRCWGDPQVAAEHGAMGVAILLMMRLTEYTVVERSRKGPGFDYWLGYKDAENEFPFQQKARLEISGISKGDETTIRARVKSKLKQTERSDGVFPAYVVVVEFGAPTSRMVKK